MDNLLIIILIIFVVLFLFGCSCSCKSLEGFSRKKKGSSGRNRGSSGKNQGSGGKKQGSGRRKRDSGGRKRGSGGSNKGPVRKKQGPVRKKQGPVRKEIELNPLQCMKAKYKKLGKKKFCNSDVFDKCFSKGFMEFEKQGYEGPVMTDEDRKASNFVENKCFSGLECVKGIFNEITPFNFCIMKDTIKKDCKINSLDNKKKNKVDKFFNDNCTFSGIDCVNRALNLMPDFCLNREMIKTECKINSLDNKKKNKVKKIIEDNCT